jgi:hypothetical protein
VQVLVTIPKYDFPNSPIRFYSSQGSSGASAAKWTDEEVEMLHRAVRNFSSDLQVWWVGATQQSSICIIYLRLQVISETIKERTVLQIKTALQKKAYEEAGIQVQNSVTNNKIMQGDPDKLIIKFNFIILK